MKKKDLYRMVTTAVLLAIGMVLPFLTGQMQAFGKLISPLHIPVFICGLTCGPVWGAALGLVLPILRSVVFGMPRLMPTAVTMMGEMAMYGLITGLMDPILCRVLKRHRLWAMLLSLVIAMLAGRAAGGVVNAAILSAQGSGYSFAMFVASYFSSTLVGAAIHLVVVPVVVLALEKARLTRK